MTALRDTPIRRKLMIIFLLTTAAAMVAMRLAFFGFEFHTFRQATLQQGRMLGEVVAKNSSAALAFGNVEDAREILSSLSVDRHLVAAALYRADGSEFVRFPEEVAAASLPTRLGEGYEFRDGALVGFEPVREGERRLGTLYLHLDTGTLLQAWLKDAVVLAVSLMAAVLGGAYLVARALTREISDPILSLAAAARTVTERGDYSLRVAPHGRDELGGLTTDFNRMLGRVEEQNREIRAFNVELESRVVARTAELEEANRELEAFSYSVSHDLRAPLRHINGFVQLLAQKCEGKLDATEARYLAVIAKSAHGMGVLIDELLSFSRMGRVEMKRSEVDAQAMVKEVVAECVSSSPGRRIDWRIGALPTMHADPSLLRQVWRNLIGNAVKYTAKRELAVVEISATEQGGDFVFSVRDNGAGFDMQYAEKLFGVFQRLHSHQEFEGTGIGLANVRRIVQRHGGRVWAEAEVDRGATFHFTLPLRPAPAVSGSNAPLP